MNLHEIYFAAQLAKCAAGGGNADLSELEKRIDILEKSIVKLDSIDEFNALTEKTADWYFIKEG